MTDVILSGVDAAHEKRLRSALASLRIDSIGVEVYTDSAKFLAALEGERPRVVALGPGVPLKERFSLTRRLFETDPTIAVLIVDPKSEETVVKALESGARGVLPPDGTPAEMRSAFERALDAARRLRAREDLAPPAPRPHSTIVVVSAKGGAGKTVVAVNLAAAMALEDRRQVAIIDLDLQFGDVATALLLTPEHTIVEAAEAIDLSGNGSTALKVFLARHSPTDLFALCAPESPAAGEKITPAMVGTLMDALAKEFRYQVVDTSAGLEEHTLIALDRATDVVVVVDLDVPSVRGGRKMIEALDAIGMRKLRRHVVLNRADSKVGLKLADVATALNVPIDVTLPSSRAVPVSYNEGTPIVVARPRHEFTRGIGVLAARLMEATAPKGTSR